MYHFILFSFFLISICLIILIIIQQDKVSNMERVLFGSDTSNAIFGSSGSSNFLTRLTAILTTAFFILVLLMGNLEKKYLDSNEQNKNFLEKQIDTPINLK